MTAASDVLDRIDGIRNKAKPEDRKPGEPEKLDRGMRGDLAFVVDGLQWAWTEAWSRVGWSGERGVVHKPLSDDQKAQLLADPWRCFTPGAKYDFGQGNHLAQQALLTVGPRLTRCDAHLGVACIVVSGPDDTRLPAHPRVASTATLHELLAATDTIRWRLNYIADRATMLTDTTGPMALRSLKRADKQLSVARSALEVPQCQQDKNNPTAIDPDNLCSNCETRARLKDRKRCATCHTYKQRNGCERPADLDAA